MQSTRKARALVRLLELFIFLEAIKNTQNCKVLGSCGLFEEIARKYSYCKVQ